MKEEVIDNFILFSLLIRNCFNENNKKSFYQIIFFIKITANDYTAKSERIIGKIGSITCLPIKIALYVFLYYAKLF